MIKNDAKDGKESRHALASALPLALVALAFSLTLTACSPASAHPLAGGDQHSIDSDGAVSRRLDLGNEDDRRLLATLIMKREGRVYAFEKKPKTLNRRASRERTPSPQVFNLEERHDADRLAAAISSGRSIFFVALQKPTDTDDAIVDATAHSNRDAYGAHSLSRRSKTSQPAPTKLRLVAERVSHYGGEGEVGRRVDLGNPLDRLRLSALISKRKGRVYGFTKGDAITDEPEIFDLVDNRDADRLSQQISSGRHVFFMVEETTSPTAKHIDEAGRRGDMTPASKLDETIIKSEVASSAGGPIQLFPKDSDLDQVSIVASSKTRLSDAGAPVLEFLDRPRTDSATNERAGKRKIEERHQAVRTRRPAAAAKTNVSDAKAEQIVAALSDEIDTPDGDSETRQHTPTPIATLPGPASASPSRTTPSDIRATMDEAETIASLERDRRLVVEPAARDTSSLSAKQSGDVVAVDAPKQTHDLAVGEGRLVRLSEPIAKLLIADPGVADAQVMSDDLIYIFGNEVGQTNIFGLTADERVMADFDVRVVGNVAGARARLRELQPDTMADYTHVGGQVVAQGLVRDPAEAYQVAALGDAIAGNDQPVLNNTVMPGAQQVNIRVRFAEVSRNDIARLGMNWQAILDSGDFLFGLSSGNLFLPDGGGVNSTESFGSVFGNGSFGDFNLDIFLEGLEREGIVNVLAEPNLTAINGRPANFLAGGEIPIPVPQSEGIITIDYKPFGVSLEFLPTLMPGNRINLQVRPEVSSIVNNGGVVLEGFNIPAFTVRRAETAIELASGQTFAIAGLFQRSVVSDIDKFPVMGDVPVIGNLFKSPRFQRAETELVILITPYLVQPTPSATLTVPNQRVDRSIPPLEPRQPATGLGGFIID